MHLAISPVLLDRGESVLAGIDLLQLGFKCAEQVRSPAAVRPSDNLLTATKKVAIRPCALMTVKVLSRD